MCMIFGTNIVHKFHCADFACCCSLLGGDQALKRASVRPTLLEWLLTVLRSLAEQPIQVAESEQQLNMAASQTGFSS